MLYRGKIPSARGPIRCLPLARVFLLVPLLLTSQVASSHGNPNPGIIPPHARAHGRSYAEWGAQWWRWAYSFPVAQFPPSQSGELDCGLASPARSGSLPALRGKVRSRVVHHPSGKALFFPIITLSQRLPLSGPQLPTAPRGDPGTVSTEGAAAIIDLVTELEVVVDGQPLNDLFSYRPRRGCSRSQPIPRSWPSTHA
jgi:hypothetical protein